MPHSLPPLVSLHRTRSTLLLAFLATTPSLVRAVPPDQRTIYDSWIADSQYQQKAAARDKYWASRTGPAQYKDYSAELSELNAQSRLQKEWEADDARMRAREAAREAVRRAREEEIRAIGALYDAARAGDADALMTLAKTHESSKSDKWGLHEYELVFGPRRTAALWRVVDLLRLHAQEPEYLTSFRSIDSFLGELAATGDTRAAKQLAQFKVADGDDYEAAKYFAQAASGGDAESQQQAITLVATDRVDAVPVDPAQFYRWCETWSGKGDIGAQLVYGRALARGEEIGRNPALGLTQLQKAIAQNSAVLTPAQRALRAQAAEQAGLILRDGRGVSAAQGEGLKLLELAATQGSVTAQLELGKSYFLGLAVAPDTAQAIAWLTRAAERENAHAAALLGHAYLRPEADETEIENGLRWLKRAAKRRPDAMIHYGKILYDGAFGLPADADQARTYFGLAIQHYPQDREVLEFVGDAYVMGDFGLRPNPAEGKRLLQLAAAQGSVRSTRRLEELARGEISVPR